MLKLLLGRSGTGKTAALLRAVAAREGGGEQILLVPEQHSHHMERELCRAGGGPVSLYAEVLSFTRLANRVFSAHGGLAAPALDPGGRLLLMYSALRAVSGQLKVYQRPSRKPAFLTGLIATADELKSCCVTPEQLCRAGEETGGAGEADRPGPHLRGLRGHDRPPGGRPQGQAHPPGPGPAPEPLGGGEICIPR